MKLSLIILQKNSLFDQAMTLNTEIIMGRSSQCNFQLNDQKASGRHCSFTLKKNKLELTDLNSKNGTFLNGIRVEHAQVFFGDQVTIGDAIISVDEKLADEEARQILVFSGNPEDKNSYGLVADFSGARIKNRVIENRKKSRSRLNQDIKLKKIAKNKIWLSKREIRLKNPMLSKIAAVTDSLCLVLSFCLPIFSILEFTHLNFNRSQILILLYAVGVTTTFYVLNFKVCKFTLGETLSGIKNLYLKQ